VQFPSDVVADDAIRERNKADMGGRYVELFASSAGEAARAAPGSSITVNGRQDVPPATPAEVEDWLRDNGVDDRGGNAFRELDPVLQRVIMERGDMKNTRNPSSVLLSRIKTAQNETIPRGSGDRRSSQDRYDRDDRRNDREVPPWSHSDRGRDRYRDDQHSGDRYGGPPRDVASLDDEIEDFIRENNIDLSATEALRRCSPAVKEYVLEKGDVKTARNPSSALLARVKEANNYFGPSERARSSSSGGNHGIAWAPPNGSRGDVREDAEEFLRQFGVDDRASDALRALPEDLQRQIMDRGGLANARNPSSVLLARIREVGAGASGNPPPLRDEPRGHMPRRSLQEEVDDFIRGNDLDNVAADALRGCTPDVQDAVLDRGSLATARNPSSAVLSRIRDAQGSIGGSFRHDSDHNRFRDEVEHFIHTNNLDPNSADTLRNCLPSVQRTVISRGGLSSARNPSSVLNARIREASAAAAAAERTPCYVRMRGVPFSAAPDDLMDFFRGFDPFYDSIVIGVNREGRPSGDAFIQFPTESRAEDAIKQLNRRNMGDRYIELFKSTDAEAQAASPPDPYGAGYGAGGYGHDSDRSGGGLYGPASDVYGDRGFAYGGDRGSDPRGPPRYLPDRVEDFLRHGDGRDIDSRAAEAFRACDPEVQEYVLEKSIAGSRNPSSALMARIKEARSYFQDHNDRQVAIPGDDYSRRGGNSDGHDRGGGFLFPSEPLHGGCGGGGFLFPSEPLHGQPPGGYDIRDRVEDYIRDNPELDDVAVNALRRAEADVQENLIGQSLRGARNPSSILLARMRDARQKAPGGRGPPPSMSPGWGPGGMGSSAGKGSDPHMGQITGGNGYSVDLQDRIERFLRSEDIDRQAADALRDCAPQVQEFVIDRGIVGARNPSSALLARIRDAKEKLPGASWTGNSQVRGPSIEDVERFVRTNDLDARAADALRQCEPSIWGYVLDRGVTGARNPSSALIALIKEARSNASGFPQGGGGAVHSRAAPERGMPGSREMHAKSGGDLQERVEQFLRSAELDARATEALRMADPGIQQQVIDRGNLHGARNPSSALLARIRDAKANPKPAALPGRSAGGGGGAKKRSRSRSRSSSSSSSSSSPSRKRKRSRSRKRRKKRKK